MKFHKIFTMSASTAALFAGSLALADSHQEQAPADTAPETEATAQVVSTPKGPAMWRVADEDTTIYLFGTVHALPPEINWYDDQINDALLSADTFVTEIDMSPGAEAEMQQIALAAGSLPEGETLRALLSPEQNEIYEAALAKIGMPAPTLDQFEPWMAALTLTMVPLLQQGYSADSGVEEVLKAKLGEAETGALETIEEQIAVFDTLAMDKQVAFMMEAAEGIDETKAVLDAMVAEWIEGDADALAVLMNDGLNDAEIADKLLYNRNANWADWITTRLDEPGTIFIAVGAGHLAGEKSVQDYLAQKGIQTDRLR